MKIPSEAKKVLGVVQKLLAESLLGFYLHGSVVNGGLQAHSDVDLLAVIDQPMSPEARLSLTHHLMKISGRYPSDPKGRRPVELMVFLQADLVASVYPARSEFLYGEWLRNEYETGKIPNFVCDPELTLVLAQAQQEAMPLVGPKAICLLPVIAPTDIHRAIKEVLPTLMENLEGDERNILLTLARMWRTLVIGDFVAKDVAAEWAAARLPSELGAMLLYGRERYLKGGKEDWQHCQHVLRLTVNALYHHVQANL